MPKVHNRAVIHRVAIRDLRQNRKMNIVIILSVMLTCILFTCLFSVGGSLINGMQQETMRQVGGDRMAGLKYVLPEDFEKLMEDKETRDVVYRIIVGNLINKELKNVSAEVNCAGDGSAAKAVFCYPQEGRLPEKIDEIAMSTLVLDELGLPHELGTSVPAVIDIDGKNISYDMTLCGYWPGDPAAMAQECWVSRAFAEEYAPTPTENFYTSENHGYAGYWMVDFNYKNSFDIEQKTEALLERLYGNAEIVPDIGVNWAYLTSSADAGTIAAGILLMMIIFVAGYLIIFNIFHINISANIRNYGLLKTIGTTSRQIRRIVRVQALTYSVMGIPAGLAIGVLLGNVMLKSIMRTLEIRSEQAYTVSSSLLILLCLASAAFTFITVMISSLKPCRIAGNVSPIEALRFHESGGGIKRKSKKTGRITPGSMAVGNLRRSRKKAVIVILSLTLSLVLVNTLFTVLNGIDEEKYISNRIVGDILIRWNEKSNFYDERAKGITPDIIAEFDKIDGAELHPVYYEDGMVITDETLSDRLNTLYQEHQGDKAQSEELERAIHDQSYSAHIYGIDGAVARFLEPTEGAVDVEKFQTGKYAIIHTYLWNADDDPGVEILHPGETVTVKCGDRKKEYEVMAVCSMIYPLSTKIYSLFETQVIIPTQEYLSFADEPGSPCIMINASENGERIKEQCRMLCDRDGSSLVYSDKQTHLKEFQGLIQMIQLVGGALSGILALIGILNFVNVVVTEILSRSQELAMMSAVGMTGRQQKAMLCWEGIYYAFWTTICSVIVSSFVSCVAVKNVTRELFFYRWSFTILPIIVCVLTFLALSILVPYISYRMICKTSIVDRIRSNG